MVCNSRAGKTAVFRDSYLGSQRKGSDLKSGQTVVNGKEYVGDFWGVRKLLFLDSSYMVLFYKDLLSCTIMFLHLPLFFLVASLSS